MTPLAFVAIHTAGPDQARDDLVEIAVAHAEPYDAGPLDVYSARICSTHGGHDPSDDTGAVWLVDAMDQVRALTRGCVLAAFDASATRGFLESACYH